MSLTFQCRDDTFTTNDAGEFVINDFNAFDQVLATVNNPRRSEDGVGAVVSVVATKTGTHEVTYRLYRRTDPTANTIEPAKNQQVTVSTLLATHS